MRVRIESWSRGFICWRSEGRSRAAISARSVAAEEFERFDGLLSLVSSLVRQEFRHSITGLLLFPCPCRPDSLPNGRPSRALRKPGALRYRVPAVSSCSGQPRQFPHPNPGAGWPAILTAADRTKGLSWRLPICQTHLTISGPTPFELFARRDRCRMAG